MWLVVAGHYEMPISLGSRKTPKKQSEHRLVLANRTFLVKPVAHLLSFSPRQHFIFIILAATAGEGFVYYAS